MICGHEPWNKLELDGRPPPDEVTRKVKAGMLPHIPDDVLNTKDPELQAIRDAMLACYTIDPKERPSARSIATFLDDEYKKLRSQAKDEMNYESKQGNGAKVEDERKSHLVPMQKNDHKIVKSRDEENVRTERHRQNKGGRQKEDHHLWS